MEPNEECLTLKQVAAEMGLSIRRMQQLVKGYWSIDAKYGTRTWYDPEVPAIKRGREFLIKKSDLPLIQNRRKPGGWRGGLRKNEG